MIDAAKGVRRRRMLIVAVTANLLLLGIFKYANFLVANLDLLLRPLGAGLPKTNVALPLGISFFTFHCLSYVIDVYRGRFRASRDWVEIALYVTLFPQLVAGPIVRYKTVARQLKSRSHRLALASAGARIFVIGLAQKVLIADELARLVEGVFDRTANPTMADAWLGLVAYTLQIYFDFAGYSNMAIGLGFVLGFTLPRNFRLPYASLSITEFWRRWHMSLSAWLRDYLYIPLGGSRGSSLAAYRNLLTVFLLCGLWHGASWTFVLWGAWHGTFLVIERVALGAVLPRIPAWLCWAYTMLAVMGGWVLFRAHSVGEASGMYAGLIGANGVGPLSPNVAVEFNRITLVVLVLGAALAILPRWLRWPDRPKLLVATADAVRTFALLVLAATSVGAGTYSPFLYLRF